MTTGGTGRAASCIVETREHIRQDAQPEAAESARPRDASGVQYVVLPPAPSRQQQTLRILQGAARAHAFDQPCLTAARTHPGLVRERNEDQYIVALLEHGLEIRDTSLRETALGCLKATPGVVMAVADGVGGLPGGELASAMAIDAMAECALRKLPALAADPADLLSLEQAVESALRECQDRMRSTAQRKGLDARIATTLTLAYVQWPSLHILHVGDSRAYLVRAGKIVRLTRDQTVAQELRDAGVEQLRSELNHILTNAVGGASDDLRLEARSVRLERGDVLLLCTDGLYEDVDEPTMARELSAVRDAPGAELCADRLIAAALRKGAPDNVTVVIGAFP
jgi:serine/threonine protein phosphatase PrpC